MKELKDNMKQYIGIKVIKAVPMNRLDYNVLRGWKLPDDKNGSNEGYLVEYVDGGKANVEGFDGYISWSPKDVFERSYKSSDTFKDRLNIEFKELNDKFTKLDNFISSDDFETKVTDKDQRFLLTTQKEFMAGYLECLEERISKLNS